MWSNFLKITKIRSNFVKKKKNFLKNDENQEQFGKLRKFCFKILLKTFLTSFSVSNGNFVRGIEPRVLFELSL